MSKARGPIFRPMRRSHCAADVSDAMRRLDHRALPGAAIAVAMMCACSGRPTLTDAAGEADSVDAAMGIDTGVCEPRCRAGYVCIRGACVSACNPPCAAGEMCTASGDCVPIATSDANPIDALEDALTT